MNYALVSTAIAAASDENNRRKLRDGTRLLAKMAHKYGIPITWACTAESARFLANDINTWHTEYGDEPLLMLDVKPLWDADLAAEGVDDFESLINTPVTTTAAAEHLVRMREKLPQFVSNECDKLKRAIPCTTPIVAGATWKHHVLLHALETAQFKGLWGYNHADTETDAGCPFGCFYPSAEQHNFSAPSAPGIVGIPYLSSASIDNGEGNLRASLLKGMKSYDVYLQNTDWNRWLSYVQHLNALEVIELGTEMLERLDSYLAHVSRGENTTLLPVSKMVNDYQKNCQQTEPTCVLAHPCMYNGAPVPETEKTTFFYYDAECQFTFTEDAMEPIEMKNYISPPVSETTVVSHGSEYHLPKMAQFMTRRNRSRLHIAFNIESTKPMPYGVALWGDHVGLQLAESNVEDVTWIGAHLLFARIALQPGNNDFEIILTI